MKVFELCHVDIYNVRQGGRSKNVRGIYLYHFCIIFVKLCTFHCPCSANSCQFALPAERYVAWNWIRENWSTLAGMYDTAISSSVSRIIAAVASDFNTAWDLRLELSYT